MKKLIIIISILCLFVVFSGCESKEERELREWREAEQSLKEQVDRDIAKYNDLQNRLDYLDELQDRIKNAKQNRNRTTLGPFYQENGIESYDINCEVVNVTGTMVEQ